jgi:hypothetical protein
VQGGGIHQNQAVNSLLFLFRHGLKQEFGELSDVPRENSRFIFRSSCPERR